LTLRRFQAKAVIEYREKNGDFKSLGDLKKVQVGLREDRSEEGPHHVLTRYQTRDHE